MSRRFEHLTPRHLDAGAVVIAALLTVIVYRFVWVPYADRATVHAALQTNIAAARGEAERLEATQRELSDQLGDLERQAASGIELASVRQLNSRLAELGELAEDCGVRIRSKNHSEAIETEWFSVVPIEFGGLSTYSDCATFLHRLHEQLPDIEITSVRITSAASEDETRADVAFDFAWYAAPAVVSVP